MNNGNNQLIAHDSLNPENISLTDYTNTLTAEAFRAGLLNENDIARIQTGLMETLSEVIGYYSGNKSTSVQTDRAKAFGQSILFNVDAHLLSLGDHHAAVEELRNKKLNELYGRGYLITSRRFEAAKVLYARVRYTRPKNASAEYNKTMDVKLKNYFASYDPRFTAHTKAYIMLSEYGIRGAFRIDQLAGVLTRLIEANTGRKADVTIPSGTTVGEE